MKTFTVIAGANGVGKTSLYEILKSSDDLGERINIDEIVQLSGSWKDKLLQIKAGRIALSMLSKYINNGTTFHIETTLPGSVVSRQIKKAKSKGFEVRLYYVGVDSVDVSLERVERRVRNGGHGIDPDTLKKRFEQMPENLREVLPLCDVASFYDNTLRFRRLALSKADVLFDRDIDVPHWFYELIEKKILKEE